MAGSSPRRWEALALCFLVFLLPGVSGCGGNLTAPSGGPVTSPNYPSNYGSSQNCEWLITVPAGSTIRLTFDSFDVEQDYDFLRIYDGASASAAVLQELTGPQTSTVSPIVSTSNVMFLRFTSDESEERQGFNFSYTSNNTYGVNVALGKAAFQTSTRNVEANEGYGAAARFAVDGKTDSNYQAGYCTHTTEEAEPSWWVDLGQSYMIDRVAIFNRQECCAERLNPFNIHIGDSDQVSENPKCGGDHQIALDQPSISVSCQGMRGRYVGVRLPGPSRILTLCQVQVFSAVDYCRPDPCVNGTCTSGADNFTCACDEGYEGETCEVPITACPELPLPNGNRTEGHLYGDTVTFSCNEGYELIGTENRTCQANQSWSGVQTNCSRKACPELPLPDHATRTEGHLYGDTVTFSCNEGYELIGSENRTCQANQSWSGVQTNCSKKACPELPLPNHATRTEGHLYGNTVTFSCNEGYELIGSENRTCQANQSWSGVQPNCNRKVCPELPILNNGNKTEGHLYGDTVTFSCDEGYQLIGSENRTCQANQSWSGAQTNCSRKACPELPLPNNGNRTEGRLYGDTVTFSCNEGYELIGSENRTCQADQSWSGVQPNCSKKACPELPLPNNATRTEGHLYGDTVTFSCDEGYELIGSENRTCQVDQTWSGVQPNCNSVNVALGKAAFQTSTCCGGVASHAVDGNTDTDFYAGSCTATADSPAETDPSWWVDLGQSYMIDRIVIFNRQECCPERLNPFNIHIGDSDQVSENPKCGGDHQIDVNQPSISVSCQGMRGRYVGVRLPGPSRVLTLCEVQVFSAVDYCRPDPCVNGTCTSGADNFTCACDEGYEGETCEVPITVCRYPLGMESGVIPDDSITASSTCCGNHEPYRGRLNGVAGEGAWSVATNTIGEWLQVDLGEMKTVTGTIIQGRYHNYDQWVTSYKLQYSVDGLSWITYASSDGSEEVFPGNTDRNTPVTNLLDSPTEARYVRFLPQSWHVHMSMRAEVLGCSVNGIWLQRDSSWVVDSTGTPWVDNGVTYDVAKALDGNTSTYWNVIDTGQNHNNWYIVLDIAAPQTLTRIAVNSYGDTTHDIAAFKLQSSQVGSPYSWEDVVSVDNVQGGTDQRQEFGGFQGTARYWRFVVTRTHEGWQPYLTELNLYSISPVNSLTLRTSNTSVHSGSVDSLTVEIFSDLCDDVCTNTTVSGLTDVGTEYDRTFAAPNFGRPTRLRLTTSGADWLKLDWVDVYNVYTGLHHRFSCPSEGCQLSTDPSEGSRQVVLDIDGSACPELPLPNNGNRTEGHLYGDTVTFSCNEGYELIGSENRTCQVNQTWSGVQTNCTRTTCPELPLPNYGNRTEGHLYGDTVTFSCNEGYELIGSENRTCQANQSWSGVQPNCSKKACPELPLPNNGNRTEGHLYRDIVTFFCNEGYELIGSENRTCQVDQTWSGVQPNCNKKACPELPLPNNGNRTEGHLYGDTVTFSCDEGYELIGSENRTCQADQSWTGVQPNCNRKACPELPILNNGNKTEGHLYGDTVTFSCNDGYELIGSENRTCQADQSWSGVQPNCSKKACPELPFPNNGNRTEGHLYGDTVTFSCDEGYELIGSENRTCQADQTWSGVQTNCNRKACPDLPLLNNGNRTEGHLYGDTVTFSCNEGYELIGSENRTCQADQSWSGVQPNCSKKACSELLLPNNGNRTEGHLYGDIVTFSCNEGYELIGSENRTCQADQTWSGVQPNCNRKACPELPILNNGNRTEGHLYGDTVTFSCNEGYELIGSENRTCQADQSWSDVQPNCNRKACPELPILNNGNRTEGHLYGDTVTFSCNEGYELIGSENRTCQANQTWSGVQPNCNRKACQVLPFPNNGNRTEGHLYGDTVTFSCDEGYELIGSENRNCQADQSWSGVQSNCSRKLCQQLMAPFNGNISGGSSYEDVVTYHCDPGYEISGDEERTCQSNQTWSGTQPTCVDCVPDISLYGGGNSESSAVKIARRTSFTIRSRINVICNQTYDVTYEWNVFQHNPMGNVTQPLDFPNKVVRDSQDITIPRNSLGYGSTIVELNATMDFPTTGSKKSQVQKQWVIITPSAPVAHIAGGSAKSVSRDGVLVLNASESYDPDEYIDDYRNFTFHWTCQTPNGTSCNNIFPDARQSAAYEKLQTASFPDDILTFTVEVGLPGRNSSQTSQSVTILDGVVLNIAIRCAANCETKVNPSERLVLVTQCDDCPTASTTYLWTLVGGKHIDWDVDTTTGNTSRNLVVRSNIFEAGESYTFRVDVTSDVVPGGTGFSEYSFRVNKPPTVGSCAVSPSSGDSTITQFDISCEGARDDDLPLVYSLYFNNDGSDALLHTGTTERFPLQLLPTGQEHRDFNITLEVRVSDALGATSVIRNIKVQVRPPSVEDTAVALDSLNDTLGNLLHKGDNHGLLQLTNSLSSVLNAANASSYSNDSLSKARDGLITSLTKIPVQSLDNIDQVAGALGLATALEEQVTPQSQESAAQTVLQMSHFLETPEKEDVGPERLEETASVLLRACVNILQASTASATKSKELPSSETRDLRLDKNKIATQTTFVAIGKLNAAVLDRKVPGESPTTFSVGEFNLAVEKQRCDSTNGQPHVFRANNQLGSSTFFVVSSLSGLLGDSCETEEDVGIENFKTPRNPYAFANTSDDVKSEVGGLQFLRNGRPLEIRDLTDPVEVFTRRLSESSQNGRTMTELGTTAPSGSGNISTHQFNMTEGRSVHLTVTPHLANVSVRLYLKRGDKPRRIDEFDRNTTLPLPDDADLFTLSLGPTETMTADRWTWFIPGIDVDSTDPVEHMHYLGVEHVPQTEQGDVSPSVSPEYRGENFTLNYTLQIFSTQCLYFNEESEDFESDGCQPGPLSSAALSHCRCDHLTAFGSGFTFFIAPNKLNILETLRNLNPAENPVVIIAVSVLFGIYLLVVIWARRKDRQDSKKIGATILRGDQGRFHDHFYQITVLTGSRSESSTSARVFLTLMGEGGTSGPHELEDRDRTILKEGGVDTFILPTSRHLGSLYAVHIWHDNTGPGPSWFLDKIILQDLSDGKKYSFLCQRWLAVEEGDGRVDCLLSSATDEQLSTLRHVFGSQTSKAFNDGHLWASVLGRPAYSPFTRVQRVSCCLSLLLCSMVTNIAFFQRENDFIPPPTIDILGFKVQIPISWAQFMIAVQSCLIIFPINLAIVEIFRHVASPPEKKAKGQCGSSASSITSDSDVVSLEEIELQKIDKAWDFYRQPYSDSKMTEDKKKGCILPWWCVFIAWFLVFASCVVSAFFTILYGQAYGRKKAEEWLFVFFTSFFADLFVLQPVKVVLLAVGLTLVLRKPHDDAENQTPTLDYEEVCAYLSTIKATPVKECREEPPDSTKLAEMRVRRFVEISMRKALYEFAFYFLFVLVLVVIANGPRDTGMFHMTQHLRRTVDDGGDHSFANVDDAQSFWNFVRYTLSPALYGNQWYNDGNREPGGFMADKTSYVVGPVRIRQLRVAEDPSCEPAGPVQHIFKDCTNAYSHSSHDSSSYGMGWSETPDDNSTLLVQNETNPWVYRHSPDIPVVGTHATYWDGGYFVTVTNTTPAAVLATVAQLEPSGWIDRYTRAVFIEMTVYNPHANLFSVVNLLTEFTPIGKAYPRVDIATVRLYRFQTPWAWVVVGFQGVFIIFTLYFVFRELDLILKLRSLYLKTFWGCVELSLALLSLAEVGVMLYTLYIILEFQSKQGTNTESAERPFEKYRRAAYWDQINTYVLGCLVCVGTLKLLHLLRFNKHVVLGADTMKKAAGPLSGFFFIFTIVFVAFATFAFLVFGSTEEGFSPFVATVETMFTLLLGKFYELSDAKTVMGPLFTFTFITFFQWVILTMVVAILDGAIHEVAEENSQQKPETEQVADLMLERLQSWVGGWRGKERSSSANQEDYNPTEEELTDFLTNADFVRLQGRQDSSSTSVEFCIENQISSGTV
ncbi:uncharacterized protein LOC144917204 isoform X3 [Branchiostoma floridae x Branchiostoma belcheri]